MKYMEEIFTNQSVIFYILLFVSIVITQLPWIGVFFRGLNTLIHESGHAILALLLNGNVLKINLSGDTSGSAITTTNNKFKSFLVSFSGYPFSSLVSLVLFYFIKQNAYQYVIYPLLIIAIVNLMLFVRNLYGIFWLSVFIILSFLVIYFDKTFIWLGFSLLCAFVILSESFISTLRLIYITLKSPKDAGDSGNLAKITKIPALIWSFLFAIISGILTYQTIILYFPNKF